MNQTFYNRKQGAARLGLWLEGIRLANLKGGSRESSGAWMQVCCWCAKLPAIPPFLLVSLFRGVLWIFINLNALPRHGRFHMSLLLLLSICLLSSSPNPNIFCPGWMFQISRCSSIREYCALYSSFHKHVNLIGISNHMREEAGANRGTRATCPLGTWWWWHVVCRCGRSGDRPL